MSEKWDEDLDGPAMAKCESLGLSPKWCPMGDDHHTDAEFSPEDSAIGSALAYFLGTLFADIEGEEGANKYWYFERTSIDEWSRVARALRIHGLKIANQSE